MDVLRPSVVTLSVEFPLYLTLSVSLSVSLSDTLCISIYTLSLCNIGPLSSTYGDKNFHHF